MAVEKIDVKQKSRKSRQQAKRAQRRNQLSQLRKKKREAVLNQKRKIGYDNCPPILVTLFNNSDTSIDEFLDYLEKCGQDLIIDRSQKGSFFVNIPRFKVRYQFMYPSDDLYYNLDAAKVSDLLLIIHPADADEDYSLSNNETLNSVYYHCLPTTIHIVCGLEDINNKQKTVVKKNIQKAIDARFPDEKLHKIDTTSEILQLLQLVCNCKKRKVALHGHHSLLLADKFEYNDKEESLKVHGYLRHNKLDVNSLIHIPGWTNFQMKSIRLLDDPRPLLNNNRSHTGQMNTDQADIILKPDPLKQECLEAENPPDPMEGEQTWPTPEELAEATDKAKKKIVKVPKGTSDYQAAWIIDPHEENDKNETKSTLDSDEDDDDNFEDEKPAVDKDSDEEIDEQDDEEYETLTIGETGDADYDEKMDIEEEEKALTKFREARENELFPDEIDTPTNAAARQRFARYRGLKSFIHSPWNPKENLPDDYSRIFQFANFDHSRKHIIKQFKDESPTAAPAGSYVEITLEKVPSELVKYYQEPSSSSSTELNILNPLVLVGILPYEQKMSLINVVLRRVNYEEGDEPIKSKDELVIHLGFRRFITRPIFSAHTNGDKFKFERFFPTNGSVVASFYAPITFPPASAVAYKKCKDGSHKLVAIGSLLNINPDRVVIKRIRLSGHPFKVVGKSAVVRYMFFNREDIKWFQPVELRSKYGRHGHIKEPLGTHGHMKCIFDRPLTSNDTVLMNLYKRVYPKWCYSENVMKPTNTKLIAMDLEQLEL